MSASKAELLRYIARHESLEKTLAHFPGVSRAHLVELLESVARALDPSLPAPETPRLPSSKHVRVYSDGAARGNPGPAGAGAVVTDATGRPLARLGRFLGRQTNNHAEYMGVLIGLEAAKEMGAEQVDVFADSQLMIRQLEGKFQVKSATLRPLFEQARGLLRQFPRYTLTHIPREENGAADEMSNRAIDERM